MDYGDRDHLKKAVKECADIIQKEVPHKTLELIMLDVNHILAALSHEIRNNRIDEMIKPRIPKKETFKKQVKKTTKKKAKKK